MCVGCWKGAGSPKSAKESVRQTTAAVEEVYEESAVGGNLHIVLDDYNVCDSDLDWCGLKPLTLAEQECLRLLRGLSLQERTAAIALYDGFWQMQEPSQ